MAINTGFQQQRPFAWSASVRSVPSPRAATRLHARPDAASTEVQPPVAPEEKSFEPRLER